MRSDLTFDQLDLSDEMLAALAKAGYERPTPVQAGLIPRALDGVDVMGQARTGTGKTAAFAIPILEGLRSGKFRGPQALVLVPTRELAVQVRDEFVKLGEGQGVRSIALYGGKPIRQQIEKMRAGVDVAVGTPGRVLDLMARGSLNLADVDIIVLDEADRMLDIGFRPDIEKILRKAPSDRQTLLLSATIPGPVERLARKYMDHPEIMNFSPAEISGATIDQYYFTVDGERKFDLLQALLERENPKQAIVFCRTKRGVDKIHHRLSRKYPDAECIHGDLAQRVRDRVMAAFRAGKVRILVATDVIGRGIDVSGISHIINYDIPQFCDDYVHRVGRTGRMGSEGVAYTFVSPEEGGELTRIEVRINRLLERAEIEGFATIAKPIGDPSASEDGEDGDEAPAPKPPPFGRGGRAPKKYRRAL